MSDDTAQVITPVTAPTVSQALGDLGRALVALETNTAAAAKADVAAAYGVLVTAMHAAEASAKTDMNAVVLDVKTNVLSVKNKIELLDNRLMDGIDGFGATVQKHVATAVSSKWGHVVTTVAVFCAGGGFVVFVASAAWSVLKHYVS